MILYRIVRHGISLYLLSVEIEVYSLVSALYCERYFGSCFTGYHLNCIVHVSRFFPVDLFDDIFRHNACFGSRSIVKHRHTFEGESSAYSEAV